MAALVGGGVCDSDDGGGGASCRHSGVGTELYQWQHRSVRRERNCYGDGLSGNNMVREERGTDKVLEVAGRVAGAEGIDEAAVAKMDNGDDGGGSEVGWWLGLGLGLKKARVFLT
ncbi:hypothetical protein LOK49_LG03G01239 [Camellia lanceoleosa]|uniref:Uncharacterized protein n=1 Tax=Camellia lanceoleosa TaxID=1840588 RepID=A0ACC0I9F3_9ERIC|nr:hypothetical protein LOK49_LG03G01239 [Camellia lanceoleosa]